MAIEYYDAGRSMANALGMAAAFNQMNDQKQLRNFLAQNGGALMSGDPAALSAYAQYDPGGAFTMRRQLDADARAKAAEGRAVAAAGRDEQLFQKQMQEAALRMTAQERELEQQSARITVQELYPSQNVDDWNARVGRLLERGIVDEEDARGLLDQFDNREMVFKGAMTVDQILEEMKGPGQDIWIDPATGQYADRNNMEAGAKPIPGFTPPAPEPADTYQRYVQEEQAAGRQPLSRIDFAKAQQKSSRINVSPDGTVTVAAGSAAEGSDGGPLSTGGFIDAIDGALGDPALDWSVGAMKWTQVLPGTPMARFKTRVDQLSGQAFMQARQALKGGGQITDFEGSRAEAAIARLSDSQGPQDYRDALMELRTILIKGMQRERGWIDTKAGQIMNMSAADIDGLDFTKMTPDEVSAARERLMQIAKYEE